jgi:DivIVA domain-containing protein
MPLTPADVHNVAFSKPPIGKRGYNEDEVDAFLDLIETELARLIEENNDLRNQVEQLDQQRRAAPVDTGPCLRAVESPGPVMAPVPPPAREQASPGGDHNVHAAKVLGLAQEMAKRLTCEAKVDADAMLGQARTQSEQLLCDARAKADGMVNEARTRAETLVNDAHTKAETLERDAARRHTEILARLSQEQGILERRIDELRTFERDYRSRLKTYLDSQLRDLDGRGFAAPVDPVRNRQDLVASGFGVHAEAGPR